MTASLLNFTGVHCAVAKDQSAAAWFAAFLLAACSLSAYGQPVVAVPNSLFQAGGNTNSVLPFLNPNFFTARYQQVYDASQFPTISNGTTDFKNYFAAITNGGWISDVYFRAASNSCAFPRTAVPDVEIHLSTTSRDPDALSPVFSENVGPDDTLVFSGSFTISSATCMGLEPYDFDRVALAKNFWYDPRKGNLLLDVRLYQGIGPFPPGEFPPFDAVDAPSDGISRVYAEDVSAMSGTADTTGVVTFFAMAPPPILQGSITNCESTTNYIIVTWTFTQPTGFVLQVSTSLGSDAVWQTVPGTLNTNIAAERFQFPIDAGVSSRFFRFLRAAGP